MTVAVAVLPGSQRAHQTRSRLTRERMVNAAGEILAEQGLHVAMGKQIAERAGVSVASINYHFGGMEGLCQAVMVAAYAHVIATDLFAEAMAGETAPEAQLLAVCQAMVHSFAQGAERGWQWRVISRQVMEPSAQTAKAREALLIPKILMFRDLVSALVDLPVDHPAVVHGCLSVMAPIVLMQVGDWTAIGRAFPGFRITAHNASAVAHSFHQFTLGGLRAVATAGQDKSMLPPG